MLGLQDQGLFILFRSRPALIDHAPVQLAASRFRSGPSIAPSGNALTLVYLHSVVTTLLLLPVHERISHADMTCRVGL